MATLDLVPYRQGRSGNAMAKREQKRQAASNGPNQVSRDSGSDEEKGGQRPCPEGEANVALMGLPGGPDVLRARAWLSKQSRYS
jgi:hypothetical protein